MRHEFIQIPIPISIDDIRIDGGNRHFGIDGGFIIRVVFGSYQSVIEDEPPGIFWTECE